MLLSEDSPSGEYTIRAYTANSITVNEDCYTQSLIVATNKLLPKWRPNSIETLTREDLAQLHEFNTELVLLGTGTSFKIPNRELLAEFADNFSIEYMSTPAACRTFNALSSEGRNVIAALIIDNNEHKS